MRILLAEDDQELGACIVEGLSQKGYKVDWVTDGMQAFTALQTNSEHFDLAILDINMPRKTGLEVLSEVRCKGSLIPIFILTAKDQLEDKIKGLDSGADDYIIKPFDLDELSARIRTVSRRSSGRAETTLKCGDLVMDPVAHTVKLQANILQLSRREFAVLNKLLEQKDKVVTRDILSQTLYGWDDDVDSNAIEVHIHNLRKKINSSVSIRTIRGVGYMLSSKGD